MARMPLRIGGHREEPAGPNLLHPACRGPFAAYSGPLRIYLRKRAWLLRPQRYLANDLIGTIVLSSEKPAPDLIRGGYQFA